MVAQAVSETGDYFNNIAVFALVMQQGGSGMGVSGVMLARAFPAVAAGPVAGVLLDRMNRKRIMIASDLVRAAVAAEVYRPGESLPSLRAMAIQLQVNPNTVQRAYDELEREGLIVMQHGRGTFVSESVPAPDFARSRERLRDAAQRLLSQAALAGVPFAAVVDLLEEMQKGMEP